MLWVDISENTVIVWPQNWCNLNAFGVLALLETLRLKNVWWANLQLVKYLYSSYCNNVSNKNLKIFLTGYYESIKCWNQVIMKYGSKITVFKVTEKKIKILVLLGRLGIFLNSIFYIQDEVILVSVVITCSQVVDNTNASLLSEISTHLGSLMWNM